MNTRPMRTLKLFFGLVFYYYKPEAYLEIIFRFCVL
jgi:hypothetical protein